MYSSDKIDNIVLKGMQEWKVPGLSLAVIKDREIIYCNGYGLRSLQDNLPANTDTLFPIGSITKSITVSTLAYLVRQGKLDWDKPVRDYLPDFRLWDLVATEKATTRDLLSHRTGLPPHDLVWDNTPFSRKEFYHNIRYLEPSADFRQIYQYNNILYTVAGYLVEQITGKTWEEVTQNILFDPLEIRRATATIDKMIQSNNYALPYKLDNDGNIRQIPFRNNDTTAPAGSLNAIVEDVAKYILMLMNGGRYQGRVVIDERDVAEMLTPQMVAFDSRRFSELGHNQYGLGLMISTYRGRKSAFHGGNADGYKANANFLPDEGIGVITLCNMGQSELPRLLAYQIFDLLLDLDPIPWSDRFLKSNSARKLAQESVKAQKFTLQVPGTTPSHCIEDYIGEYTHPAYGTVTIKLPPAPWEAQNRDEMNTRWIEFHTFESPLYHYHYDIFETPANNLNRLQKTRVRFETDWNGDIARLYIPFEPTVADIVFERQAGITMSETSFLEPMVGEYAIGTRMIRIALRRDGRLQLMMRGQPDIILIPVKGTQFRMENNHASSVVFQKDDNADYTGLILYQPQGASLAVRVKG